ncbi:uncharacterized protein At4g00950-like isoform X2 [Prosopis cineraria]|uniref:uncharacterized protein At4g00950-like isoform X2 n=1 Tax=Prosopis cineraria TaxID=364024 RepID=UPI00240FDA67|nr:uncharacterized protein At4g00950-like isoform X2 [Prosopis cineraria]
MGSDDGTPPKLSLLISRPTRPPEMKTPPLHVAVSVPFQWEEAPGKPKHRPAESKPKTARALELPPRLLFSEAKVSSVPSPTNVLDGPYIGRVMSFASSNDRRASKDHWNGNFGSSRWRSFKRNREEGEEVMEGSFDFSDCTADGRATEVKISRVGMRRRGSFLGNVSNTRSHFWASVCDSLKQVVPWRRRQEGQRK